jgi:predicted transcriptional regulator
MIHHVSQKSVSAPLTSEMIRAGRMLVRWDQKTLAEAAGVSHVTVRRLEAKPGPLAAERSTIAKLRSALESAGIVFVEDDGEGQGLRLKKAQWRLILDGN